MIKGLVLGKFMPLHKGHLALIHFAAKHCDDLTVLLCHHAAEPIAGSQRLEWLKAELANEKRISIITLEYNPKQLTDTSDADPVHAKAWAEKVGTMLPKVDVFFSSEAYGDAFAAHLGAAHKVFDEARNIVPVSASLIRQKPLTYWDYLPPAVQPFFVQKIAVLGSESTGKSTLTERLACRYNTGFVPEMARAVIEHTAACTGGDLRKIAFAHATEMVKQMAKAAKLLFIDTDVNITKSYSRFLFGNELVLPQWIEDANKCHLYLFLKTDCPYVQDGTRLPAAEREALSKSHLDQLNKASLSFKIVTGDWNERWSQSCRLVDDFISEL